MIKTIMNEFIFIEYDVINDAFDHEFGTTPIIEHKIKEVQIYCDAIGEFVIIDNIPKKLEKEVVRLINENEEN